MKTKEIKEFFIWLHSVYQYPFCKDVVDDWKEHFPNIKRDDLILAFLASDLVKSGPAKTHEGFYQLKKNLELGLKKTKEQHV